MNKWFYSRIVKAASIITTYVVGVLCLLLVTVVVYYAVRKDGIRYENLENFQDSQAYADALDEQVNGLLSYLHTELESADTRAGESGDHSEGYLVENRFLEGYSNISYQLYDSSGKQILSNNSLTEGQLMQLGNFIILDFGKGTVDTDYVKNMDFQEYPERVTESALAGKRLVIGVDTSFPVRDRLSVARDTFFEIRDSSNIMMTLEAFLYAVLILLYVHLAITAGQREKKDKVTLRPEDYIPLEFLLLLGCIGVGLFWVLMYELIEKAGVDRFSVLTASMPALVIHTSIVVVYLSIVRRVKAKVEWKHTLLKQFADRIAKASEFKNVVLQTILTFVIFMSVNYVCIVYGNLPVKIILAGVDLLMCGQLIRWSLQRMEMYNSINMINRGELDRYHLDITHFRKGSERTLAEAINSIGNSFTKMLDENTRAERMKADLITNVSHDIKTPLTSIINYVDLLKGLKLDNDEAEEYLRVLDEKSQRLKTLAEDLVEASRISSGSVKVELETMDFRELLLQAGGEFEGLLKERELELITEVPEGAVLVKADRRHMWRVVENLFSNAAKYSMPGTRVYAELFQDGDAAVFTLKNISGQPLNIRAEELMERFMRADSSRTTKGNGLGLSIAKDLTVLQGGGFNILLDGDLFKAVIRLPMDEGSSDTVLNSEELRENL